MSASSYFALRSQVLCVGLLLGVKLTLVVDLFSHYAQSRYVRVPFLRDLFKHFCFFVQQPFQDAHFLAEFLVLLLKGVNELSSSHSLIRTPAIKYIKNSESVATFKAKLKTFLFKEYLH